MYQPGLHIIATLSSLDDEKLKEFHFLKNVLDNLISKYSLQNLGEVYHNFSPSGFTAVVCLSESHISVHTWPEYNKVNLDIYLSNYLRVNDKTVETIFNELVLFFDATIISKSEIIR